MKTITILALLAIITGIIGLALSLHQHPDDLNGYMPQSNYVHSRIIDTLN